MDKSLKCAVWELFALLFGFLFVVAFVLWCVGVVSPDYAAGHQDINNKVLLFSHRVSVSDGMLVILAIGWIVGVFGFVVSVFGALTDGTFSRKPHKIEKGALCQ